MKREWWRTPAAGAGGTAVAAFIVYCFTLAPSVTFIDSGELAAVACTLGIAHPTGYPLFTLLGWLFSRLPLGGEEIIRLNLMSAVFCAAGVFLFVLLVRHLLDLLAGAGHQGKNRDRSTSMTPVLVAAPAAGLLLAFSETMWATATSVEVYALHVLLVCAVLYLFLRAATPLAGGGGGEGWYLFAFVLGLAFTNHMTTILLAPGLLFLYFATQGGGRGAWLRILRMGFPFLLGLSVYLYLPLRAAQGPLMNWGNPVTLEKLLWHLSGKQYRVWIFSSTEAAGRQFQYFLHSLPAEVAYAGLLPALAGMVLLWKRHRRLGLTAVLLFAGCVLYAINYDIHDIDSYFLLAYITVALWAGVGIAEGMGWLLRRGRGGAGAGVVLAALVALAPFALHHQRSDESGNRLVEDYTMNILRSLPPNALVLSYQWDYWLSASYYYQLVRGIRPDVAIVDKELLRRSWYFHELEHRYPWLVGESQAEVNAFLKELDKFEHDRPYDPAMIQGRYVGMIGSFITRSMASRPVFVTQEIEPEFTAGLQRVPEGLVFRLYADSAFHPTGVPELTYRPLGRSGRLEDMIPRLYGAAFLARGSYYYRAGDVGEARRAYARALDFDPANGEARRRLARISPGE